MNILRGSAPRERVCALGLLIGRFTPIPPFLLYQAPVSCRRPLCSNRNKFHLT
jgi:hypothetical protein